MNAYLSLLRVRGDGQGAIETLLIWIGVVIVGAVALFLLGVLVRRTPEDELASDAGARYRLLARDLVAAGLVDEDASARQLLDGQGANAAQMLIALVRISGRQVRNRAVTELALIGDAAERPLEQALEDDPGPQAYVDLRRALWMIRGDGEDPVVDVFR